MLTLTTRFNLTRLLCMTSGKRNRSAGHRWERSLARLFRDIGFPHVVTTRSESRSRDDQKIDLINKDEGKNGRLPYDVQAKCTVTSVSYPKLLGEIPLTPGVMPVILHRQTRKVGNTFVPRNDFAILYLEDFLTLVQQRDEQKPVERRLVRSVRRRFFPDG